MHLEEHDSSLMPILKTWADASEIVFPVQNLLSPAPTGLND